MMRVGKRGFTLVEVMIVVAIIALLAAIAIPNLLRARHNANESAAIGSLRTISSAMESFRAAQTPARYATFNDVPASLALLAAPPSGPAYIDAVLASGSKQGYNFVMTAPPSAPDFQTYLVDAIPQVRQTTGTRNFRVNQSGVVEAEDPVSGQPWQAVE